MEIPTFGRMTLVPEARGFSDLHRREFPQKDQLCGPFWGALALTAAGHPSSPDEVALRAKTILALGDPSEWLPPGAGPRTDYTISLPTTKNESISGTSSQALARGIEELSQGSIAVVPVAGPWREKSVLDLVEITAGLGSPCTLVGNLRTSRLWGSRPPAHVLLGYLLGHPVEAPAADWDCGHFLTIAGFVAGPVGSLVLLRDTYPELGWGGYHLQPLEAVASALERGDGAEGGILCLCANSPAKDLRERFQTAGFELRHWDNGTPDRGEE